MKNIEILKIFCIPNATEKKTILSIQNKWTHKTKKKFHTSFEFKSVAVFSAPT